MRRTLTLTLLILAGLSSHAWAQVSTDDHALDALQAPKPTAAPAPKHPARAAKAPARTSARTSEKTSARTSARAGTAGKSALPAVPATPPPNPVIMPPPFVMPAHAPPPPPTVPVKPDAAGTASAMKGGTLVTFGAGSSTLNPATLAALRDIASAAIASPASVVSITAWAPGTADDPSTPRRLSLDRALAARAVLINAGLVSERIRAVAKGSSDIGTLPADRVEVVTGR